VIRFAAISLSTNGPIGDEEVELDDYPALVDHCRRIRPDLTPTDQIAVKPMEKDARLLALTTKRGAIGFVSGDPKAMTLSHVTLDTGHWRESPREEVSDEIVDALRKIVRAGEGEIAGLSMEIRVRKGFASFSIGPAGGPTVVGCFLVWDRDISLSRWPILSDPLQSPFPPEPPWLGVELRAVARKLDPERLLALGDAERCIAWAILEEIADRS
jgi:hypothetical protein